MNGGVGIIGGAVCAVCAGAGACVGICIAPAPAPTAAPPTLGFTFMFMFSVDGFSELSKACTRCASAKREVSSVVPYAFAAL